MHALPHNGRLPTARRNRVDVLQQLNSANCVDLRAFWSIFRSGNFVTCIDAKMQHDELIWQLIGHGHCSYRAQ